MKYFNLRVAIGSPKLRRILSHWLEIRGNRLMPMWQDIRPAKIKSELSVVWQYRYDRAEDEFFGGLSGDAIQRLIGGPIKNARFRELHKGDPHFFARAKRVLFDPAIFCGRGLLYQQQERQCYGERIMLPFSDTDGHASGIFGATDYSFAVLYEGGPEVRGEVEQWFDLSSSVSAVVDNPTENFLTSRV